MIPTSKQVLRGIDGSTVKEVAEAAGYIREENNE